MFKIRKNIFRLTAKVSSKEPDKAVMFLSGPDGYMIFSELELELTESGQLLILLPRERVWQQKKKSDAPAQEESVGKNKKGGKKTQVEIPEINKDDLPF